MRPALILVVVAISMAAGCSHSPRNTPEPKPTAYGAAIFESSGGKQIAPAGTLLPQPVVVQVNDAQGNSVTGAAVEFAGPRDVVFDPANGLTDSSGQLTTNVTLGNGAANYEIRAITYDKSHKRIDVAITEIGLDYEEVLGQTLNAHYCERCHNSESTPERVSNYDNLAVKPHSFADGNFLNKMSDEDLLSVITHGGPALNKSPLMPPYGYTLSKSDIEALRAYVRAVADPAYHGNRVRFTAK